MFAFGIHRGRGIVKEDITIGNLDESICRELKLIAWHKGVSVEEVSRRILTEAALARQFKRDADQISSCTDQTRTRDQTELIMRFRDRKDAGKKLAAALDGYRETNPIVLALPRGGVPVAEEVAEALDAPLDIILVRKIGAPFYPEVAIGAVVDGGAPVIVRNEDVIRKTHTSERAFDEIFRRELAEIERRRRIFVGNRAALDPKGRVAIVIDDGIATGATMRAALQATRKRNPKKLIVAVPVAPRDLISALRRIADEVICLTNLEPFGAVGYFYDDFAQLSDPEVIEILNRNATDPARLAS